MTCGDIDGFLSHHAGKAFGVLQQDSRVMMTPVFRECIDKPDLRRKLRRLNIVKGREGAKGNESFTLRKNKHKGRLSHRLFQAVLREQAVQIFSRAPFASSDLLQPVFPVLRRKIFHDL